MLINLRTKIRFDSLRSDPLIRRAAQNRFSRNSGNSPTPCQRSAFALMIAEIGSLTLTAFAQACAVYSPNLPDTGDLIRQHGVQDQALAIKSEPCFYRDKQGIKALSPA